MQNRPGKLLALALLVARVFADHANHALAAHDLALLTDLLDARSDLHGTLDLGDSPFDSRSRVVARRHFQHHPVTREQLHDPVATRRRETREERSTVLATNLVETSGKLFFDHSLEPGTHTGPLFQLNAASIRRVTSSTLPAPSILFTLSFEDRPSFSK